MAPSIDTRRKRESTPELAIDSTWDTWVKNKEGKRLVLCNRGGECGERRYSNSATITKKYEVSTPPRNQSLLFFSLLNQSNTIVGLFFFNVLVGVVWGWTWKSGAVFLSFSFSGYYVTYAVFGSWGDWLRWDLLFLNLL